MVQELIVFSCVVAALFFVTWKYLPARARLHALDRVIALQDGGALRARLVRWRSRVASSAACPGCDNCGACEDPVSKEGTPTRPAGESIITIHRTPRHD